MKGTSWRLVIPAVLAVGALIACGTSQPPTGPSLGPSSGPGVGPSSGPGVGPSSGPGVGPSSGPGVGPSTGPGTGPSSGPGVGPGHGGGGPSPTPNPSGTPTPNPSPTACTPQTVTFDAASQLPLTTLGGNFQGPVITVNDPALLNCSVTAVRVTVAATATDLTALGGGWVLRFDRPGAGPIGFDLLKLSSTLSGSQLGTGCGSLVFADTGTTFATDAVPYDGTFAPFGSEGGNPGFQDYLGKSPEGDFGLYPAFLNTSTSLTITCYKIAFDLQ